MFGFGFALVPFYNQICAALGVGSLVEKYTDIHTPRQASFVKKTELFAVSSAT